MRIAVGGARLVRLRPPGPSSAASWPAVGAYSRPVHRVPVQANYAGSLCINIAGCLRIPWVHPVQPRVVRQARSQLTGTRGSGR